MFRKILCWLGFHRVVTYKRSFGEVDACKYCGKLEDF